MSHSFPRTCRLLKRADFKRVFARPIKSSDAWFTVFARLQPPAESSAPARLGLAIARKQLKRAVDRNRIKRLIREYFRLHIAPESSGIDYVVMTRAKVREQTNQRLTRSLARHFARIHKQSGMNVSVNGLNSRPDFPALNN